MSKAKHTKGPWQVDDLGEDHFADTNHRWGIGSNNSTTYRVAKIEGMGEEAEANAKLIAAAPELLAACEAASDALDLVAADQSRATDPRCGLVQPISVAEGEEINATLRRLAAVIKSATT